MRGALILIEGCDRSGKSTQCKMLADALTNDGVTSQVIRFPDRSTPIGKVIDSYLSSKLDLCDQALHLLFSANRWELVSEILRLIKEGVTVILDRYSVSGVAYTYAKKSGLSLEWCKSPEAGLPKPDAVFYLNLTPEASEKRGGYGNERYENVEFQKAVSEAYELLKDDQWQIIDADKSVEDLNKELLTRSKLVVEQTTSSPLGVLW